MARRIRNNVPSAAGRALGTPERVQDPEVRRLIEQLQDEIARLKASIPTAQAQNTTHANFEALSKVELTQSAGRNKLRIYQRRAAFQDGRLVQSASEEMLAHEILLPAGDTTVVQGGGGGGEDITVIIYDVIANVIPTGWGV